MFIYEVTEHFVFSGPAPEGITNKIFEISKSIQEYHICPELKVDLSTIGKQSYEVETLKSFSGEILKSSYIPFFFSFFCLFIAPIFSPFFNQSSSFSSDLL